MSTSRITKYSSPSTSIGVELDSWGGLIEHTDKKYYPAKWDVKKKKNVPNLACKPIDNVQVYDKPFRGYYAFERYTDEQIETLRQLLLYWKRM